MELVIDESILVGTTANDLQLAKQVEFNADCSACPSVLALVGLCQERHSGVLYVVFQDCSTTLKQILLSSR